MQNRFIALGLSAATALVALSAIAADATNGNGAEQHLTIKNKAFDKMELDVPANQKIKIAVKNEDKDAAEFESGDLDVEKIVPAGDTVTVNISPLDPGTYTYFNDFDPNKVQGKIVAK